MASSGMISIPREKCMKCRNESDILLSSCTVLNQTYGLCSHKFCQNCFRTENTNITINSTVFFKCPCCRSPFYENMVSIDEAILIGEAATMRLHISNHILLLTEIVIATEEVIRINEINKLIIDKLETALLLNPSNFYTLYTIFLCCCYGHKFLLQHIINNSPTEYYRLKIYKYSYKVLNHRSLPIVIIGYEFIKTDCYHELASLFTAYCNFSAAYKYTKLAYENSLRSSYQNNLSSYKELYITSRSNYATLPPLRFALGDEVEFLFGEVGSDDGNQWRLGKIIDLYYRDSSFDINFTAPYRILLLDDNNARSPVHAWVAADIDRYVRKVGVKSIEDTRYQVRLNAKVEELAQVFNHAEFIQDIYHTLAQDQEFIDMLQSVWQMELSESTLRTYRILVMHREPLVRTDSGYHIPSADEVIAGIRAFFDPAHLSGNASSSAVGEETYSKRVRSDTLSLLNGTPLSSYMVDDLDVQGQLLQSILCYGLLSNTATSSATTDPPQADDSVSVGNFIPLEISESISLISTSNDIVGMQLKAGNNLKLKRFLDAWLGVQLCLENPSAGSACECPFMYFFIKQCVDDGLGVPKLALALYDRMNMQLSREFIRCANPSCELNRLDQSTGQVKFKKCSRCLAVIYCSRQCQLAHYPDHKPHCLTHVQHAEEE